MTQPLGGAFHPVDFCDPMSSRCARQRAATRGAPGGFSWCKSTPAPSILWQNILVRLVNIIDRQDGEIAVVAEIAQGDAGAGLEAEFGDGFLGHIEGDGHGEEEAGSETVLLDDAVFGVKSPVLVGLLYAKSSRGCPEALG